MVHPTKGHNPEDGISVERIAFLDTGKEFEIIRDGEWRGVALKPLVEDMGLDWRSQRRRILKHATLSKGVVKLTTPSEGGMQETTCLSLRRLPFYLATLNPRQIQDPLTRHRVELYQEYAVDVIFEATFGKIEKAAKLLASQVATLRHHNDQQKTELIQLRKQGSSLKVQGELFANADKLSSEAKVRGLLAAFSRPAISMAAVCRYLKDETGFDPYPIREQIAKMGGRATLLKVITAHGYADRALDITCRLLQ